MKQENVHHITAWGEAYNMDPFLLKEKLEHKTLQWLISGAEIMDGSSFSLIFFN